MRYENASDVSESQFKAQAYYTFFKLVVAIFFDVEY